MVADFDEVISNKTFLVDKMLETMNDIFCIYDTILFLENSLENWALSQFSICRPPAPRAQKWLYLHERCALERKKNKSILRSLCDFYFLSHGRFCTEN